MRILHLERKGYSYEFRYYDLTNEVEIYKDGKFIYHVLGSQCNCPGAVYNHKCWHISGDLSIGYNGIGDVKTQPKINEPWAEWAEEAKQMQNEIQQKRRSNANYQFPRN